jgi:hypothetical protein
MQLSCLSPQQAADIIQPYIRSRDSRIYISNSGISALTVRGTPDELAKSRDLINHFERDPSAACRATATTVRKLIESLDEAGHDVPTVPGPAKRTGPSLLGPGDGRSLLTPDKATTPLKKE